MVMAEFDRLSGGIEWIDLELVERKRTPEQMALLNPLLTNMTGE